MKLADISIKRPVFATVMVSVLAVFGVWGYLQLSIDMFPDVEFPICTVTATYPGADPETIESRVIDKLEEAISAVNGIKTLRSTSMESVGLVFVQFELERKADRPCRTCATRSPRRSRTCRPISSHPSSSASTSAPRQSSPSPWPATCPSAT